MVKLASIHDFGKSNDDKDNNGNSSNQGTPISVAVAGSTQTTQQSDNKTPEILINYNDLAKNGKFSQALFRDAQIMQTISVLTTKKKPNVLLVGEAGVGKTQIVEEIARRLAEKDPIVRGMLKNSKIYELPLGQIVNGASYVGQLEERLYEVIEFASDPKNKVILFIDEIHQIMQSDHTESSYNKISQILKPAMSRGGLRIIGATTSQEATSLMNDPAFSRRWSRVQVPELTVDETVEIVQHIRDDFQNHHGVILPDALIEPLVQIADEYKQYGSHRPDTAITLLDKAMSDARVKRLELEEQAKTNQALQFVIQAQPRPVLNEDQLKKSALALLIGDENIFAQNHTTLEQSLQENIIGQDDAKKAVLDAVKRLGLRLSKRTKPVSFLFAGPSGTGKTEIAKHIAKSVFGSKDRMIYINMSEYSNTASLNRIIGSPAGYVGSTSKRELPFDTLENNPYQLVLLDEFEKADRDVQRFFMQALDEGIVKTNRNTTIDFTRTIIIATTNAGVVEMSKRRLGFGTMDENNIPKWSSSEIISMLQASFDTELLNRFEKIIPFTSIGKEDYTKILAVKYNQLIKEAIQNRRDLQFTPSHVDIDQALNFDVLKELADKSYTPQFNGRPAERTMREYIENTILENPNNTQFNLL